MFPPICIDIAGLSRIEGETLWSLTHHAFALVMLIISISSLNPLIRRIAIPLIRHASSYTYSAGCGDAGVRGARRPRARSRRAEAIVTPPQRSHRDLPRLSWRKKKGRCPCSARPRRCTGPRSCMIGGRRILIPGASSAACLREQRRAWAGDFAAMSPTQCCALPTARQRMIAP
jgi:hypothetical protein